MLPYLPFLLKKTSNNVPNFVVKSLKFKEKENCLLMRKHCYVASPVLLTLRLLLALKASCCFVLWLCLSLKREGAGLETPLRFRSFIFFSVCVILFPLFLFLVTYIMCWIKYTVAISLIHGHF